MIFPLKFNMNHKRAKEFREKEKKIHESIIRAFNNIEMKQFIKYLKKLRKKYKND